MTKPLQKPLFCFGSLMNIEVLTLVSDQPRECLTIVAATAPGHLQREVVEESYPVLIAQADGICDGIAIYGLTDIALQRILFFEGEEYCLREILITVADKQRVNANYFADSGSYTVKEESWDFDAWQRDHLVAFLPRTRNYMQWFGSLSAAEADRHW